MEWLYLKQVTEEDPSICDGPELAILYELIPNLFSKDETDNMHYNLFSNPICHGGGGVVNTNSTITVSINLPTYE